MNQTKYTESNTAGVDSEALILHKNAERARSGVLTLCNYLVQIIEEALNVSNMRLHLIS